MNVAEQASHAWIDALLPGAGWTGFDPTLRRRTTDHHIRVAVGRDYADVPPLRGVCRGSGAFGEMRIELTIQRDGATAAPTEAGTFSETGSQQQ